MSIKSLLRLSGPRARIERLLKEVAALATDPANASVPMVSGYQALLGDITWHEGNAHLEGDSPHAEMAATKLAELARRRGLGAEVNLPVTAEAYRLYTRGGVRIIGSSDVVEVTDKFTDVHIGADGTIEDFVGLGDEATVHWEGQEQREQGGEPLYTGEDWKDYPAHDVVLVHPDDEKAFISAVARRESTELLCRGIADQREPHHELTEQDLARHFADLIERGQIALERLPELMAHYAAAEPDEVRRMVYADLHQAPLEAEPNNAPSSPTP